MFLETRDLSHSPESHFQKSKEIMEHILEKNNNIGLLQLRNGTELRVSSKFNDGAILMSPLVFERAYTKDVSSPKVYRY